MSDYIDRAALGIGLCTRDVFENKGYADGWNAAVKILKKLLPLMYKRLNMANGLRCTTTLTMVIIIVPNVITV